MIGQRPEGGGPKRRALSRSAAEHVSARCRLYCVSRALPSNLAMANVMPATRLLEKRRQMFEVQDALEAQKQDFARKVSRAKCFGGL